MPDQAATETAISWGRKIRVGSLPPARSRSGPRCRGDPGSALLWVFEVFQRATHRSKILKERRFWGLGTEDLQDLRLRHPLPLRVGTEHRDRPAIHGDGELLPAFRLLEDIAAVVPEAALGDGFHKDSVA